MAVTPIKFTKWQLTKSTGLVNVTSDTFKLMLLDALTVGSLATSAQFVADVLAAGTQTASGGGYTTGGKLVASPTYTEVGSTYQFTTATDFIWTGATFSPGPAYALLYDSTPATDATRPVVCLYDLGGAQPTTGTFTLTINASGIWTDG